VTDQADNATEPSDPFAGFDKIGYGFSDPPEQAGQPEEAKAVEASAEAKAPEAAPETPKGTDDAADTPEAAPTINFDGFSDTLKATYEGLLKAGHVTPEQVEEARKGYLRQDNFSRKTNTLARERDAFKSEMEKRKEDLALLDQIRSDDALHEAWLQLSKGKPQPADPSAEDDDGLADKKTAAKIADERYRANKAKDAQDDAKQRQEYGAKKEAVLESVRETMRLHSIDVTTMRSYLDAEESTLDGADPFLTFTPKELTTRLELRHRAAVAEAKAAALQKQIEERTQRGARTSKQSSPPAPRVSGNGALSPLQKTEQELGLDPEWSNVQGFGWRPGAG
jgi:hypothetical protein